MCVNRIRSGVSALPTSTPQATLPLLAVLFGQAADDGDLLAVDDHGRIAREPAFRKSTGDPLGRVARVGLL
jgi:hypothetical protein